MLVISVVLIIALSLFFIESILVKRSVNSIQNRIHVNGTRGKSTVTEYIAAAMHQGGDETLAKITGTIPTIIHNGNKTGIKRSGGARVQEQFETIRYAAKKQIKTLVLECMSINPELQKIESRFFKPHIYIITNIRDDHREVMGLDLKSQTEAICNAIPSNCRVITIKSEQFEEIKTAAESKSCSVIEADLSLLDDSEKFRNGVFGDNLAIALTTCQLMNIDPVIAKRNLQKHIDQERSKLSVLNQERGIRVLHGFDVNDTASATSFLSSCLKDLNEEQEMIIIFNTRADRPLRTDQFAEWIAAITKLKHVILTGTHRKRAQYSLKKHGVDNRKITEIFRKQISNIKPLLLELSRDETLVLTIGNIAGEGFKIEKELR
jgi:gamma-polyglutamate synthase